MKALVILALGYLIDFFDLTLFAAARSQILNSFHIEQSDIMHISRLMFNSQALGIALGGVLTGVWGDKIGRMSSVRFGIFLYSTAILLSVFTTSINWFVFYRFLAGVGLAGELASSVTFMTEIWEGKKRDFATTVIYFSGVLGGILATTLSTVVQWQTLFIIGAFFGYMLLFFRMSIHDSKIFLNLKQNPNIQRGSLILLFFRKKSFMRVIALTALLTPFWFMVYFINFGPEVAKQIGMIQIPTQSLVLTCFFIGSVIGTYLFGYLSMVFKSRKKIMVFMVIWMFCIINLLMFGSRLTLSQFYFIMILLGIGCGYPGIYTALAAESFGTNQRTTGTCMVTCLGRSSLVLINFLVPYAIFMTGSSTYGIALCNIAMVIIALIALYSLKETHGQSLSFLN